MTAGDARVDDPPNLPHRGRVRLPCSTSSSARQGRTFAGQLVGLVASAAARAASRASMVESGFRELDGALDVLAPILPAYRRLGGAGEISTVYLGCILSAYLAAIPSGMRIVRRTSTGPKQDLKKGLQGK